MRIDLSTEERELLLELLRNDFMNLREEIVKTEGYDYKNMLKAREQLLAGLITRVEMGSAVAPGSNPTI
jgi:hypothetical protein